MIELNQCQVMKVANNDREVLDFILNKHYAKRRPSISYAFKMVAPGGKTLGVLTYGKPASHQLCIGVCGGEFSKNVYELNRLVLEEDAPKNSSTYLIARAERYLKTVGDFIVVSYADTQMGHYGYTYQASNFIYTGATAKRTDKYVPKGKHARHYVDSDKTAHLRKIRSSKHRYVKFVGSRRFVREARRSLRYPIEPYPKGDSKHYVLGEDFGTPIYNRNTGEVFYE